MLIAVKRVLVLLLSLLASNLLVYGQGKSRVAAQAQLFEGLSSGSIFSPIMTRNSFLTCFPQSTVHISLVTAVADTIWITPSRVNFLKHRIDTTLEISTTNAILVCERASEPSITYYYSLYAIEGFPDNRLKLLRSSAYMNSAYDPTRRTLLLHPLFDGKEAEVDFLTSPLKKQVLTRSCIIEIPVDNLSLVKVFHTPGTEERGYSYAYDIKGDVFGYRTDSTGISVVSLKSVGATLQTTNVRRFELGLRLRQRYLFRVERQHRWLILFTLGLDDRKYTVFSFKFNEPQIKVKRVMECSGIVGRFHDTNVFIYEDELSKQFRIYVDPELR